MKSHRAKFDIVYENKNLILIRDLDGPLSVTNDAERVAELMVERLNGRRLLYIDSQGDIGELLIRDGKFTGFGVL